MHPGIYLIFAVFFAFGWAIERERRTKLEKQIDKFYGNT